MFVCIHCYDKCMLQVTYLTSNLLPLASPSLRSFFKISIMNNSLSYTIQISFTLTSAIRSEIMVCLDIIKEMDIYHFWDVFCCKIFKNSFSGWDGLSVLEVCPMSDFPSSSPRRDIIYLFFFLRSLTSFLRLLTTLVNSGKINVFVYFPCLLLRTSDIL